MLHVLIIEDQPLLADVIADMAIEAGASSIDIAYSEETALQSAHRHAPRLIFSDVDLNQGGHGPRAVRKIQQAVGAIPAVFVTGTPDDAEALALGIMLLPKPVSSEQIADAFSFAIENCPDPRPPTSPE